MKRLSLLIILTLGLLSAKANHITGGEIFYTYLGQVGAKYQYKITLMLFRHCGPVGAPLDNTAAIAIFDRLTGAMIENNNVTISQIVELNLTSPSPCIKNPPPVCYEVGYYEFTTTLSSSLNGYIIAYQRCCRIAGINNLFNSVGVGATYTAEIPGTAQLPTAFQNNSAHFVGPDTVIVCQHNAFSYSFNAIDTDGDSLSYSFCDAYTCTSTPPNPNPPEAPPYQVVPYAPPFSGGQPMGSGVTINSKTGLVTGVAPDQGIM